MLTPQPKAGRACVLPTGDCHSREAICLPQGTPKTHSTPRPFHVIVTSCQTVVEAADQLLWHCASHAFAFSNRNMRRLLCNGVLWPSDLHHLPSLRSQSSTCCV